MGQTDTAAENYLAAVEGDLKCQKKFSGLADAGSPAPSVAVRIAAILRQV
jgi:hypothetical protein